MELRSRSKAQVDNNDNNQKDDKSVKNGSTGDSQGNVRTSYIVFVGLLLDLLAFTLILPLFPTLLDHYKKHDSQTGLYAQLESKVKYFGGLLGAPDNFIPVLFGGLLGSLFSFLQFVASPIIGGLSDRFGRRPVLLATTLCVSLSYGLWCFSSTFAIFVVARIIGGLAKGNVSLSTAIMADVSTPKTRQRGMAMIGIAFSIGFLLGPITGALFSIWARQYRETNDYWYVYPAAVALALSIIDLIFIYFYLEETLPPHKRLANISEAFSQAITYINPISLFRFASLKNVNPEDMARLQTVGRTYFLYLFLYSGLEFTLTFLTHLRFNFTSMDQGRMFFFIGTVMAIVQGGYTRRIPPGKEKQTILRGLLIIVPSFAIIGFAQTKLVLYIGLGLYALSTAVVVPCMTTLVSNHGDPNQKGILMGVFRSLGALGRAMGPVFASVLYWVAGPELCYSLGGLALTIPYFMLKCSN